jgi:alpha-amylase
MLDQSSSNLPLIAAIEGAVSTPKLGRIGVYTIQIAQRHTMVPLMHDMTNLQAATGRKERHMRRRKMDWRANWGVWGLAASMAAPAAMADPADEVMYHIMPIAWRDSDNDASRFGDFDGLTASLDYLEWLGVTGVWLNPIFISPAYHGYQHGPADTVNPAFGTEAEFINFVQQAHARGIKVYIDFVVYGISHDSPWFTSAFGNPASPFDSWLAFNNGGNTNYLGSTYNSWNGAPVGFIHWDLRDPGPRNLVTQWGQYWLDPNGDGDFDDGVDGYRLDHVWQFYPNGPSGWGYNLGDFWEPWKAALQSVNPDVFIFAEQADWGTTGAELLTAFDASFTKPFEFAARDALASGNAGPLYQAATVAVNAVPDDRTFLGIIGDHDVDRLASVIGGPIERGKAAAAVLMTQPFPPVIYFGDEIGMRGTKQNYGSDANDIPMREPFKWNAVAGPPMSNYWNLNPQSFNNAFSANNDGRSVEEQQGVSGSLLETYRELISTRKANHALTHGGYVPVDATHAGVWAFVRQSESQTLLVLINLTGSTVTPTMDLSAFSVVGASTTPTDVRTAATFAPLTDANKDAWSTSIGAYDALILSVDFDPFAPPAARIDGVDVPDSFLPQQLQATQDTPTAMGDNFAELNQLFVAFEPDGVRVGITGNLPTDGTALAVLIDAEPGGQSVLDLAGYVGPPAGPGGLDNAVMDPGFEPELLLWVNAFASNVYVDLFSLPGSGGHSKRYMGVGSVGSGNGLLAGGDNPHGLQVAIDNGNAAGVTSVSASGAASAQDGFEILLPLQELGGAPVEVGLSAFLIYGSGSTGNQWLPGVGGLASGLGSSPDLSTIAGEQFVFAAPAPACPGDIDGDGGTDLADFQVLAANFGAGPGATRSLGDLSGDGWVNLSDFSILANDFGCP